MPFIPIRFYAPDLEPSREGAVRDGEGLVPTINGFAAAPSPVNSTAATATASVVAAVSLTQNDGTVRTFAATATELLELEDTSWTDRSKNGNDYTAATSWVFAQLGDQTFATNNQSAIQVSNGAAFTDLTGAPRAAIVETVNNQVFALDTNDSTFGDQADRWRTSALGEPGDWVPSISTQAASARLVSTPGPITGGRRLGDDIAIYKEESIYLGRFFGPPTIWEFDLISDEVGTVSHHSIIPLDTAHAFMGRHDFFIFNGSSVQSLGEGMRENFFRNELNRDFQENVIGVWDKRNMRLLWYYPSQSSNGGALDRYIAFSLQSRTWSPPSDLSVETAFEFNNETGPTYDTLGNSFATYEDMPQIAYEAGFWGTVSVRPSIFNTSHKLQTLDGAGVNSEVRIFDFGANMFRGQEPDRFTFLRRVRPRFAEFPDSGTLVNSYRENLGDSFSSDAPTATLIDGKFDVERESRWHSVRMNFTGDMEIVGADIDIKMGSDE